MSSSFLESALAPVDHAASLLGLNRQVVAQLKRPERSLEETLTIERDSGTVGNFPAWRIQWNSALGPHKGGIRYHPAANLDEVSALSALMTWKNSLAGLPLGGGKGAIQVDPKQLSEGELERLSRAYVRAFFDHLGPDRDVPAPDVNTNAQIMAWMNDEYSLLAGRTVHTFTGKPVGEGGSEGREVATSYGGFVILKRFIENLSRKPRTVAIQGFGNVGSNIAKFLFEDGFTIVAVSDSKGGVFRADGLDIPEILDKRPSEIGDESGYHPISNADLLELPVDVLIPSAIEGVITSENAPDIKAKVILEMANGPVDASAEPTLDEQEITIIPDIMANSGGVTGSYFEMLQNQSGDYWTEAQVLEKLEKQMEEAWAALEETRQKYNINYREAAFVRAVERVAEALP